LQLACCMEGPAAGLPQGSGSRSRFLLRHVVPSQVLLHGAQLNQSSHSPSAQCSEPQGCVLQGCACSLLRASQALPPWLGIATTSLVR